MNDFDEAVTELDDTVRRLAEALGGVEGALVSEWTLIIGTTDPEEGNSLLDVVTSPTSLKSHTLGQLRFAQVTVERSLFDE